MQIHPIPVNKGMTGEELGQRIQTGWIYFGRQSMRGPAIVSPSNPNAAPGVQDVDIWVLPEPTIPLPALAQILVKIHHEQEDSALALDDVARAVFGEGILPLVEAFASAAEGANDEADSVQ